MSFSLNTYMRAVSVVTLFALALPTMADVDIDALRNRTPDDLKASSDKLWEQNLRPGAFQEREINENQADAVVEVKAPFRSEDPVRRRRRGPGSGDADLPGRHQLRQGELRLLGRHQ